MLEAAEAQRQLLELKARLESQREPVDPPLHATASQLPHAACPAPALAPAHSAGDAQAPAATTPGACGTLLSEAFHAHLLEEARRVKSERTVREKWTLFDDSGGASDRQESV